MLPRRASVDLGAIAMKGCPVFLKAPAMVIKRYSAFLKAPALLEPHHHNQDTHWREDLPLCSRLGNTQIRETNKVSKLSMNKVMSPQEEFSFGVTTGDNEKTT